MSTVQTNPVADRPHPNDLAPAHDPMETHPNLEVIEGLREVADFLAAHPELPAAFYATVSFRGGIYGQELPARALLGTIADALGDRACESISATGDVVIDGAFTGGVKVAARADLNSLRAAPPVLEYEPIIRVRPEPPIAADEFGPEPTAEQLESDRGVF